MKTTTLELEIVPAEVKAVSTELAAPQDKALAMFSPFQKLFVDAHALLSAEASTTDPKAARELRLKMRAQRGLFKRSKDDVKADILMAGRVADWYFNKGTKPLEDAEARLEEIEKAAERAEAARKAALSAERTKELSAFGVDCKFYDLGSMPAEGYAQLLSSSKIAHEAKLAAEAKAREDARIAAEKAEAERIAREKAEAAERERVRLENERLRAEVEAARKEKEAAEAKSRAEREAAEKAAAAERARVAKERAEAEAKAKAEREAIEAKARAEKAEAERLAKIERDKREALERAERERVAAEKRRQEQEAAAAARAAAAPDRDKLNALADLVETIEVPDMATAAGRRAASAAISQIRDLAKAIRLSAASL